MKSKFIFTLLLISQFILANFTIKGEVKNYNSQPILIKIFQDGTEKFLTKIKTDANGNFTYEVPMNYTGKVILEFTNSRLELLANNQPIEFQTDISAEILNVDFNSGINKELMDYYEYEKYQMLRNQYLKELQTYYTSDDTFFQAINAEMDRISTLKNPKITDAKLNYYIQTKDKINSYANGNLNPQQITLDIENHMMKDGAGLEEFGFIPQFVSNYISYSITTATSMEEAEGKIATAVDNLLTKVETDTPRGQAVLTTVINMMKGNNFPNLANKYVSQAASLTCEITPELQSTIDANQNMVVGKKAPNLIFDEKVNGKKSLYDIKANKKLIIFYGSWCPHCRTEMPFIKEFYKNFKSEGGEIIAFAIDMRKEDYLPLVEGTEWFNYSDLLKWNSPVVKEFGIDGTPTMILLNENNEIVKIGDEVADFVEI